MMSPIGACLCPWAPSGRASLADRWQVVCPAAAADAQPASDVKIERPAPWYSMVGFAFGTFPDSIKNFAWDLFVLFLYTQVLGLSGTLTGLALLIAHERSQRISPSGLNL